MHMYGDYFILTKLWKAKFSFVGVKPIWSDQFNQYENFWMTELQKIQEILMKTLRLLIKPMWSKFITDQVKTFNFQYP